MKRISELTIAIPIFGKKISPRFDCASTILLVTVVDGVITQRRECAVEELSPLTKVRRIVDLGAKMVVCGGIDQITFNCFRKERVPCL